MDKDFNFSSCIHCGQCVLVCPTGALHEKHNITEVQEYLNKPEIIKVIQYSSMVTARNCRRAWNEIYKGI